MRNIGTKEARKVNKFQCKSTTMTTTSRETHMRGTILGIRNGIRRETPILNGQDKKLDKFFNNNNNHLETLQLLDRQWDEIGSFKAVGYNAYNGYYGSNDIHLDRQSPFGQSSLTQELQSAFAQ
eukprot:17174-Amphidinium_carterae.1